MFVIYISAVILAALIPKKSEEVCYLAALPASKVFTAKNAVNVPQGGTLK